MPFLSPRPEREGVRVQREPVANLLLRGAPAATGPHSRAHAERRAGAYPRIPMTTGPSWIMTVSCSAGRKASICGRFRDIEPNKKPAVPKNKTAFPLSLKLRHGGISVYCAGKAGASSNRATNSIEATEEQSMYYSSGNYEAFARPQEAARALTRKSAYIIGSGLAALCGGLLSCVRDGQMKGERVHILEKDRFPAARATAISMRTLAM